MSRHTLVRITAGIAQVVEVVHPGGWSIPIARSSWFTGPNSGLNSMFQTTATATSATTTRPRRLRRANLDLSAGSVAGGFVGVRVAQFATAKTWVFRMLVAVILLELVHVGVQYMLQIW